MRADNTFVLYVLTENVLSEYCPFHPITPNLTPFPETWFQVSCLQQYESPFCPTPPQLPDQACEIHVWYMTCVTLKVFPHFLVWMGHVLITEKLRESVLFTLLSAQKLSFYLLGSCCVSCVWFRVCLWRTMSRKSQAVLHFVFSFSWLILHSTNENIN